MENTYTIDAVSGETIQVQADGYPVYSGINAVNLYRLPKGNCLQSAITGEAWISKGLIEDSFLKVDMSDAFRGKTLVKIGITEDLGSGVIDGFRFLAWRLAPEQRHLVVLLNPQGRHHALAVAAEPKGVSAEKVVMLSSIEGEIGYIFYDDLLSKLTQRSKSNL